ncbi:MAG: hypothetical protein HY902_00265 [Deltaproteobacteria bacterium]|nr:hypothetical protein [Deltaproteobacteria bacterium]
MFTTRISSRALALATTIAAAWPTVAAAELDEPKTEADCAQYKPPTDGECQAFVRAKIAKKKLDAATAYKEIQRAGAFLQTGYGKGYLASIKAMYDADVRAGVIKTDAQAAAEKSEALDVAAVVSLAIGLKSQNPICPGGKPRLFVVSATMNGGGVKEGWTNPKQKAGKLDHDALVYSSPTGTFKVDPADGVWTYYPDANPLKSLNGFVLQVALKDKPAVKAEAVIAPSYDCLAGLFISGTPGTKGVSNANGGDGGPAADGIAEVGIIASKYFPKLLIMKGVSATGTFWYAGAADAKPRVEVRNQGGAGGPGAYNASGWGFNGGNGGNGAGLEVRYDKRHPELADLIAASTPGGAAGPAGGGTTGPGRSGVPGAAGPSPVKKAVDPKTLFAGDGLTLL